MALQSSISVSSVCSSHPFCLGCAHKPHSQVVCPSPLSPKNTYPVSLHQNPRGLLTLPRPSSSFWLSSPLPVLQLHRLFGSRTSPGAAGPGTPMGAALPGPGPGFSSSPWSGAGAATAGNANGGRGLLRLGPPGRGETGMGGEEGRDRKALPLPGEFAGWGPSGTAGGPSLGTGTSGITAGMSRGGVRCLLSPRESHAEATKSS